MGSAGLASTLTGHIGGATSILIKNTKISFLLTKLKHFNQNQHENNNEDKI